jgi:MFS family permease
MLANPGLRRLQLALAGSQLGEWTCSVTTTIVAYEQGGLLIAGAAGTARMVPGAVIGPFAAALADRHPRRAVMLCTDVARFLAVAAAAAAAATGAPAGAVLGPALVVPLLSTVFRPAQAGLLPALAADEEQLSAANGAVGVIFSSVTIAGPIVATAAIGLGGPVAAFAASALMFAFSAVQLRGLPAGSSPAPAGRNPQAHGLTAGLRAIAARPALRAIALAVSVQSMLVGGLNVLIVVEAVDRFGGRGSAGVMLAAMGAGGLVGGAAALALTAHRTTTAYIGSGVAWGAAFAMVAFAPSIGVMAALMAAIGAASAVTWVAEDTLLQRLVPDEVRGRAVGAIESLAMAMIAAGAAGIPALIGIAGLRQTTVTAGVLVAGTAVAICGTLRTAEPA